MEGAHGFGEALPRCGKLFHLAAKHGLDEGVAGGKVAVESSGADLGAAGDVIQGGLCPMLGEGFAGNLQDALAIALRIGAWPAFDGRHGRLVGHVSIFSEEFCNRIGSPFIY